MVDTEEVTQTAKATTYTPPVDKERELAEKMAATSVSLGLEKPQRRESTANKAKAELMVSDLSVYMCVYVGSLPFL